MSWSGIPYAIEAILGERKKRDEIRDKAMKKLQASTTGDRTMTEIEKKALALVNEVERDFGDNSPTIRIIREDLMDEALCRAIEQHEAYKQEVSDAVESYFRVVPRPRDILARFILPKPDPLVEAWIEATGNTAGMEPLNEALAKRGLKIVETEQ